MVLFGEFDVNYINIMSFSSSKESEYITFVLPLPLQVKQILNI